MWSQWTSYRQGHIIESLEKLHPLLVNFVDMAKEDIQFWISKFVAEAKHKACTRYAVALDVVLLLSVVQLLIFLMLLSLHCFRMYLIPA